MNELQQRAGRIDDLVGRIEVAATEDVREHVRELVDVLLEVHGSGIEALLDALYDSGGQSAVDGASEDELVGSLLLLHGLHPMRREARVHRALESVRPYLQSHGGDVDLVDITDEGELLVRLQGSCDGCPSSSATLRYAIEEAVYKAAPDIQDIAVVDTPGDVAAGPAGGNGASEAASSNGASAAVPNGQSDDDFIPMTALTSDVEWDDCPFPNR